MAVLIKDNKIGTVREYSLLQSLKSLAYLYECEFVNGCANGLPECCFECKPNYGYLKYIKQSNLSKYKEAFSDRTGFWDRDEGCRLEVKLRSVTCITHLCKSAKDRISNRMLSGLIALETIMRDLENIVAVTEVGN